MRKYRRLNLVIGISFLFILLYPSPQASGEGIDQINPVTFKEIKRIDFRDLPENIEFVNPSRIAFNSKNELFVTDTRANNIKVFDADGKFLKIIGQEGKGPGDLNRPSCITFNRKYIIVWELGNYRFSLFNEDGEFIRHFKPKHPAVVWKLKSLGNGQIVFEIRQGYCENEKTILYILDKELEKEDEFYSHPIKREHYENKIQDDLKIPFGPLVSWDVMEGNKVIIGYQEEYRIDVFSPDKEKLFSIERKSRKVKVTQQDKKEYFSSLMYMTNGQTVQGAPPEIRKYTEFPKLKPYYKDILVSPEKEIWVFLYTESDEQKLVDIFDEQGYFAKRIQFEKDLGYRSIFAADGTLWTVIEDDSGYNVIVQYKIEGKT
jgi:hypothetical protein